MFFMIVIYCSYQNYPVASAKDNQAEVFIRLGEMMC